MVHIILLVCMSGAIQAASKKTELSQTDPFTKNTQRVFDARMVQGYTDIEQSDRDAADSAVGKIYKEFANCGLNTIAQRCPSFVEQAQEQQKLLLYHEDVQENHLIAQQQCVEKAALDVRVEYWNRFRFSFDAAHKVNTQRRIMGIEIKSTPSEVMLANEYLPLTESQQELFVVALLTTACNWTAIDKADTAAFTEIFKDSLNPIVESAIVGTEEQRPAQSKSWFRLPSWPKLPGFRQK